MLQRLIYIVLLFLGYVSANGQMITYSKLMDFFPLNGELGSEIYEIEDGYIMLIEHDCIAFTSLSNTCISVIKINETGEAIWMLELNLDISWIGHYLETPDAYYISGTNVNTSNEMALAKVSKAGELIWQKELDYVTLSSGGLSIFKNEFDQIRLVGARRRPWISPTGGWEPYMLTLTEEGELIDLFYFNSDYNNTFPYRAFRDTKGQCIISYIYCIDCGFYRPGGVLALDKNGNILWRNESPPKFVPLSSFVEQWSEDVYSYNWYHSTNPPDPNWVLDPPAIYFIDQDGILFDSLIFHNQTEKDIFFTEFKVGMGLVGTGWQFFNLNNPKPIFHSSWLFYINQDRNVAWERAYVDTTYGGTFTGMVQIRHTRDGGFIAVGALSNTMTGVFETHVWLLKLDSMGCLTPGCDEVNIITNIEPVAFPSGLHLHLYPNPTTTEVNLSLPPEAPDHDLVASLLSSSGQVLRQQAYLHPSIRFDPSGLPPGMYYVTVHRKGSLVGVEKLVVKQ